MPSGPTGSPSCVSWTPSGLPRWQRPTSRVSTGCTPRRRGQEGRCPHHHHAAGSSQQPTAGRPPRRAHRRRRDRGRRSSCVSRPELGSGRARAHRDEFAAGPSPPSSSISSLALARAMSWDNVIKEAVAKPHPRLIDVFSAFFVGILRQRRPARPRGGGGPYRRADAADATARPARDVAGDDRDGARAPDPRGVSLDRAHRLGAREREDPNPRRGRPLGCRRRGHRFRRVGIALARRHEQGGEEAKGRFGGMLARAPRRARHPAPAGPVAHLVRLADGRMAAPALRRLRHAPRVRHPPAARRGCGRARR